MNYSVDNTTSNPTSNLSAELLDCSLPIAHGIALISTNAIVGVLGTLGNLLVCVAVVTNRRLRRPSNYLLFSLAIADLIVTMVCEPLVVAILANITFFNDCAANLEHLFKIFSRLSCAASVVHMAAISVDRFIAIVYPLHYKSILKSYGLKALLITSWIFPMTAPVLGAVVPENFPKGFLGLGMFALSYATVFMCYSLIVISLAKHRKERNQLRAARSSRDFSQSRRSVEVRVAFTLAIVIVVFTVSWFPLVATFFATGKLLVKSQGIAYMWIRTLGLSNSAMNFLIYGARMRSFREAFAAIGRKYYRGVLNLKFSRTRSHNLT
ncbi:Melanocortin receptor 5 [Desmophyllum pertusum]|uniref:Melanocortin receptor 5 n=1 Tax=Desmophyllum pertusum TaxID=174260 RepID=A0A9W9ZIW6_9CNID|nr:Melanocortin receptor 5 [Desmophyllum pertusum]